MPQGKHSALQGELVTTINAAVKSQRIARAFPKLRCTFGGRQFFDRPTDTLPVPAFGVGLEWTIADLIELMKG